jgi:GT2 family glycosyltransferase
MFSLVIPTYNRAGILKRVLSHLLLLEEIQACEIIVINDGSTDDTSQVLNHYQKLSPAMVRTITIENGGPARARNHGVKTAKNDLILFIDDDVFPRPGMLLSHFQLLELGFTGSQGILLWHEEVKITPLIRYIDSRGSQFAFDQVKDPLDLNFAHVYTGNFAVRRNAILDVGGFDERIFDKQLSVAAFEDTILGYRLSRNGAKLALNRDAIADHLHDMTEDAFFHREFKVGYAIGRVCELYPEVAQKLGWDRKDFLSKPQSQLLQLVNSSPFSRKLLGYSLSMRLRNREAFYRGFVRFKQEAKP